MIVREVKDYCAGIVTARGETIAQSRGSIPTFVADLGTPCLMGSRMYGEEIHEDDIMITNWARVCGQHLNNVGMFKLRSSLRGKRGFLGAADPLGGHRRLENGHRQNGRSSRRASSSGT